MQNYKITEVKTKEQIAEVARIAFLVWHEHYASILSKEQIDYMIDKFQSVEAVEQQILHQDYRYFLIGSDELVGYLGIKPEENTMFLSKLYILKEKRGLGYAKQLLEFLTGLCAECGIQNIYLTVNRYNVNSIQFYEKKGFQKIRTQTADIGKGYIMDDYIMEKTLPT